MISLTIVLSTFIHNISLKLNRKTTASNLFHASLLRRVAASVNFIFHFEQNYGLLVKLVIKNKKIFESSFAPSFNCLNGHETTVF